MKAFKYLLGAAALMALSPQVASGASLGTIEYARFTNSSTFFSVDLGGAHSGFADALITNNEYNGAATLPAGVPLNYSIQVDRTYNGDGNAGTADSMHDRYFFKLDPASMGASTEAWADATLTIATGYDTGMTNVEFTLYEGDEHGAWVPGGPVGYTSGAGNILVNGLTPGNFYMMRVTGNLRTGAIATNVGRYDIVLGLEGIAPVPVPPAILMLLTGLGAMFGFGRMRRKVA